MAETIIINGVPIITDADTLVSDDDLYTIYQRTDKDGTQIQTTFNKNGDGSYYHQIKNYTNGDQENLTYYTGEREGQWSSIYYSDIQPDGKTANYAKYTGVDETGEYTYIDSKDGNGARYRYSETYLGKTEIYDLPSGDSYEFKSLGERGYDQNYTRSDGSSQSVTVEPKEDGTTHIEIWEKNADGNFEKTADEYVDTASLDREKLSSFLEEHGAWEESKKIAQENPMVIAPTREVDIPGGLDTEPAETGEGEEKPEAGDETGEGEGEGKPAADDETVPGAATGASEEEYTIIGEDAKKLEEDAYKRDPNLTEEVISLIDMSLKGDFSELLKGEVDPATISAELEAAFPGASVYLEYKNLGKDNSKAAKEFKKEIDTLETNMKKLNSYFDNPDYEWRGDSAKEFVQLQEDYKQMISDLQEAVGQEIEANSIIDYIAVLSEQLEEYEKNEIITRKAKETVGEVLDKTPRQIEVTVEYNEKDPATGKKKQGKEMIDNPTWQKLKNLFDMLAKEEGEWHTKVEKCVKDIETGKKRIAEYNERATAICKKVHRINPGDPGDPGGPGSGGGTPKKEIEYVDTTQEQMKYYQEMDTASLISLANLLKSLADEKQVSLNKLLTDSKYAEVIRKLLLNDSSLSAELRKALEKGDPAKTQTLLKSIVFVETNEAKAMFGFDRTTVTPIYNLMQISANSTDVSSYIKNGSNVKRALSDIGTTSAYIGALNSSNVTSQLTYVYNGDVSDDFSDTSFVVIRSFLDEASDYKGVQVEELLTSSSNVQEPLVNLYKTTNYLSTINNYSDEDASIIITNMFNSEY